MHRRFRLDAAYGLAQFRYVEPNVRVIVGTLELPAFAGDLKRLTALVND